MEAIIMIIGIALFASLTDDSTTLPEALGIGAYAALLAGLFFIIA